MPPRPYPVCTQSHAIEQCVDYHLQGALPVFVSGRTRVHLELCMLKLGSQHRVCPYSVMNPLAASCIP